jgi:glycerol-3-phosphate O-acyltransferase / dihydroxyacetone phosphate acyltransferase
MLYSALVSIIRIAVKVFFRKIHVRYEASIPDDTPLIIAANHPSTFMDAMVIGAYIKRPLYFLAKGSLFTNRLLTVIFDSLHMVPIYRKQDDPSRMDRNEQVFERCYEFLSEKKALLIFPEGISKGDRRLSRIKTGTARIALGAEASHGYRLGVTIVPAGLNYTDVGIFRSELYIRFAAPIDLSPYCQMHYEDDQKAVNALTDHVRERLETHTINIESEELEALVENIEILYKSRLSEETGPSSDGSPDDFSLSKGILDAVNHFSRRDPQRVANVRRRIDTYIDHLKRIRLRDDLFQEGPPDRSLPRDVLRTAIFTLWGLPIYLYGVINNYLIYKLIDTLTGKISDAAEYHGPVKLVLGLVLYPIFYGLQCWAVTSLTTLWWIPILYAATLPTSGFFALHFWDRIHRIQSFLSLLSIFYRQSPFMARLMQQRLDIMDALEKAHKDYVDHMTQGDTK